MIKREYEFSKLLRLNHWIRAAAILILVVTGFYIANPFIIPYVSNEPVNFMNAWWRFWHIVFGFVLIASTILKLYLFIFDKQSKNERVSFFDFISPKVWFQQLKYYLFMGTHPKTKGIYNPLQFVSYFGVFIVIFLICLTGLILHMHVFHGGIGGFVYDILRPAEVLMGGLANVRVIHHICTWIFIIFVPIHMYMAIFNSVYGKHGSMDSIFSGYVWHEKHDKNDH